MAKVTIIVSDPSGVLSDDTFVIDTDKPEEAVGLCRDAELAVRKMVLITGNAITRFGCTEDPSES